MAGPRSESEDPDVLLPEGLALAEFRAAAEEAETVLDVQRRTRLPRNLTKRVLARLDGEYDLTSAAEGVEALREEQG